MTLDGADKSDQNTRLNATRVELWLDGVNLGMVTMTSDTTWTKQVSSISPSLNKQEFLAKSVDGTLVSSAWNIEVVSKSGVENFEDQAVRSFVVGNTETFTSGLSAVLKMEGIVATERTGISKRINPPTMGARQVVAQNQAILEFIFRLPCQHVSFGVAWIHRDASTVTYYNRVGRQIGKQKLPVVLVEQIIEAQVESGELIASMEFFVSEVGDGPAILIDNIAWTIA